MVAASEPLTHSNKAEHLKTEQAGGMSSQGRYQGARQETGRIGKGESLRRRVLGRDSHVEEKSNQATCEKAGEAVGWAFFVFFKFFILSSFFFSTSACFLMKSTDEVGVAD